MIVTAEKSSASTLLGRRVLGASGASLGRVVELVVDTSHDAEHVSSLILRKGAGRARTAVPVEGISIPQRAGEALHTGAAAVPVDGVDGSGFEHALWLERDLLDQQIIDVDGRKVVRVNDVNLTWEPGANGVHAAGLRIDEVEVGVRGLRGDCCMDCRRRRCWGSRSG